MKPFLPRYCSVALAALALAACQQSPAPAPTAGPASATAGSADVPVIPAPPASAGTAGLPGDHAVTPQYKIAITLPTLPAAEKPLGDALRATADNAKRDFLQSLPDADSDAARADRQFQLLLDFKVAARTAAFTSVRETGSEDTGGAHPIPVQATFVYDRKAQHVITLDDLFAEPEAARKALAKFARPALQKKLLAHAPRPGEGSAQAIREWKTSMVQMLDQGTRPTTVNFSLFVVRQGEDADAPSPGLMLVFAPYQVAPYVYGTQTVEVPASVFASFLKPAYRSAFVSDQEPGQ